MENVQDFEKERQRILFVYDINSELRGLEFQKSRIFNQADSREAGISPVHDADFYVILLRRLYRRIEKSASCDSRVANLKGQYNTLVGKVKIRDHFEHGVDLDKMPIADLSDIPAIKNSIASQIANIKIVTSVFINKNSAKIVSGSFQWDLYKDHNAFNKMVQEFSVLFPFKTPQIKKQNLSVICQKIMKKLFNFR